MLNRFVAHITIQAKTPLKVGSNNSDFLQDAPVQRDWNGLPMILGTSLAGVLRKELEENEANELFGKDTGSKVILSNALLVDENNHVHETLLLEKSPFLQKFNTLPIREHTAINAKGVVKKHAKFDEEVVYAGTRFKFSLELIESDEQTFNSILEILSLNSLRIGGGSTKGFGKFEVISITTAQVGLQTYTSSLNDQNIAAPYDQKKSSSEKYINYSLTITPDNFFMFGSGFGDEDADMTPVFEKWIDYDNKKLSDKKILIPASSIKGALAHRTTYHYNLQNKLFIGNSDAKEQIEAIFGSAKNSKEKIDGTKGKLLISDCYKELASTKTFDHVSIDRFTGGAIDGALFQEKTIADDRAYTIEILLEKNVEEQYVQAFEAALNDVTTGMLPLGGATTKGHGSFNGTWSKS